jgi:hypothetical protein
MGMGHLREDFGSDMDYSASDSRRENRRVGGDIPAM